MKNIISLTQCVACELKDSQYRSEFHFKGHLKGELVIRIIVDSSQIFIVGDEYILHLKVVLLDLGSLYCHLIREKNLKDLKFN